MIAYIICGVLFSMLFAYGVIVGGTQKTPEEQRREDEEQAWIVSKMYHEKYFDSPEKWLIRKEKEYEEEQDDKGRSD